MIRPTIRALMTETNRFGRFLLRFKGTGQQESDTGRVKLGKDSAAASKWRAMTWTIAQRPESKNQLGSCPETRIKEPNRESKNQRIKESKNQTDQNQSRVGQITQVNKETNRLKSKSQKKISKFIDRVLSFCKKDYSWHRVAFSSSIVE